MKLLLFHKCEIITIGGDYVQIDVLALKHILIKKNITWTQLSKKSGISKTHLSRINKNKCTNLRFPTIKALENSLGVDSKNFLKNNDERCFKSE